MEREEFMERFMKMAKECADGGEAIVTVTNSGGQSCSQGVYRVDGNTIKSNNEVLIYHPAHEDLVWEAFKHFAHGIHLLRFSGGECIDTRHIRWFNPERLFTGETLLAIYQEYGLEPINERDKNYLAESIKAEKIKNTLVWACYIGDKELIKQRLNDPKLKPAQLNKALKLAGNPLILCAKHDDLESFKAIVEKGADISKKTAAEMSPLMTAFRCSYDIVMYIYENHREQFDKEVKDFTCLSSHSDKRLYQLLKDIGCDMMCEGRRNPLLHTYAQCGNTYGIKFLLDNGVDIGLKNQYGMTALEMAERNDRKEAAELLRSYIK